MENEIIEFNKKQSEINRLKDELSIMEKGIIKKYCPYKKGDKVIFTEWWRGNNKDYFGVVDYINFKGLDENAIDGKWVIVIKPTTKDFKKYLGSYNSSLKYIGEDKRDVIRKYND
jgi:hypothetical protein